MKTEVYVVSSYSDEGLDEEVNNCLKEIETDKHGTVIDIKFSTAYYQDHSPKYDDGLEHGHLFSALIIYKVDQLEG